MDKQRQTHAINGSEHARGEDLMPRSHSLVCERGIIYLPRCMCVPLSTHSKDCLVPARNLRPRFQSHSLGVVRGRGLTAEGYSGFALAQTLNPKP